MKIKEIDCVIKYTPSEMRFSAHNRDNHIVGIQLCGSAVHYFKNRQFTIGEGCIYFLNQAENYDVEILEKGVCFSVHFTTYEPIDTESFCIKASNSNEIVRLLNLIEKKFTAKTDELDLLSASYSLCSEINKIYQKSYFPGDKRMTDAEIYINTHFTEKDCLSGAVRQSMLTQRRFNDLFKNHFGITPNRYIVNLKIDYAKKLLRTNYFSIAKISETCGFSDIYYFCKVFKQNTGSTPLKYKNEQKNAKRATNLL